MQTAEIRQRFLDFFQEKGHEVRPSSSLVPADDPTLLFTNAGMVQFKRIFLGQETVPYDRAVTSQKCVRAGGKHNDLEEVGVTTRHHTFFEMLGNFSFGDYFKKDAIAFAWELMTEVYGLDPDRVYATVHHTDDEEAELWASEAGLGADHMYRLGDTDNFWKMADTGPCGPGASAMAGGATCACLAGRRGSELAKSPCSGFWGRSSATGWMSAAGMSPWRCAASTASAMRWAMRSRMSINP